MDWCIVAQELMAVIVEALAYARAYGCVVEGHCD